MKTINRRIEAALCLFISLAASAQCPGPAAGCYDDGYVLVDISGNAGGLTWYWGYQSSSQIQGGFIVFHRRTNLDANTEQLVTDTYDLGGILPPLPPYRGTFQGPGPLIHDVPVSRSITVSAVGPRVSNVRSAQRPGTQLVDIDYDLADAEHATLTVSIAVSTNGGASYTLPATSFTGALGAGVTRGVNKRITWNAGQDWPNKFSANVRFRITASDGTAPSGMVLIPAGNFTIGDTFSEGGSDELPLHTVYVSAFYMDKYEASKALWDDVYQWATNHSYGFDHAGSGKAANHPAQTVNWYDTVKWCNARSEKEGRVPAYYTSAGQTTVYRSGQINVQNDWVKWNAGYRLPTEAEWEKAARGGASGHRFPWTDADTITHSRANYYSSSSDAYDISPTRGYHPAFNDGVSPYTSPVGYFAPNGYGLYDMAGNVWDWCGDWYGTPYAGGTDPRGPASGSNRVLRGGGWSPFANYTRCADRSNANPSYADGNVGFRCVRGL